MYFVKTIKNILYSIHRFLCDFPKCRTFNTTPNENKHHFQENNLGLKTFLHDFPKMQNFNTTPNESENHFQV